MAFVMVFGEDENKPKLQHLPTGLIVKAELNRHTWADELDRVCMNEERYNVYARIAQCDEGIRKLTQKLGKVKAVMAIRNCQRLDTKDPSTYEDQLSALTDAWREERLERRLRR